MSATDPTRPVVLSLGMGVDSVAVLTRWLLDPTSRDFDLDRLVVLTAMTGDEYTATGRLMTDHVLPLLRSRRVRYVQVSRAGQSSRAGYTVLDDSPTPTAMHLRGPWRLSDELRAVATVPQVAGGRRLCSIRAKGEPLDAWIGEHIGGPHTHVVGFSADEQYRIDRDQTYRRNDRQPYYPLAAWRWDRTRSLRFLRDVYGVQWQRSCCTYCPFQLANRGELSDRWRRDPDAGADALALEYTALACNPRAALFGRTTAHHVVATHGLDGVRDRAAARLAVTEWDLLEVRRVYAARGGDPASKGNAVRNLRRLAAGDRDHLRRQLQHRAAAAGTAVQTDPLGIERAWLRRSGPPYPSADHLLVLAPAGTRDKTGPGFAHRWDATAPPPRTPCTAGAQP